jgi:hypothetical protein
MGASLQCVAFLLVVSRLYLHSDRRSVTTKLIQKVGSTVLQITHSGVEIPTRIPVLRDKLSPIGGGLVGVSCGVNELLQSKTGRVLRSILRQGIEVVRLDVRCRGRSRVLIMKLRTGTRSGVVGAKYGAGIGAVAAGYC